MMKSKFLAALLVVCLILSVSTLALAATHTVTDGSKLQTVINNAAEGDTIVLEDSYSNWKMIQVTKSLTIQLNGNTINRTFGGIGVDVTDGTVTIVGPGKISGSTTGASVAYDAALVLDGGVEVEGRDGHGVDNDGKLTINDATITATEYGVALYEGSVEMNGGSVSGTYGIAAYSDTKVTINDGTVSGTVAGLSGEGSSHGTEFTIKGGTIESEDGVGIYHPQNGKLNISGGTITGATGIDMKSGDATISGGTISGTGAAADYSFVGGGFNSTGDGLVIESCNYPGGAPKVTITGGDFNSANGDAVASYAGNNVTDVVDGFIAGGSFSNDPDPALIVPGEDTVEVDGRWYLGDAVPTPTPTPAPVVTPTPAPAAPVVTAAPAAPAAPKTGDNTNIALWMSLMVISGVALLGLRKKAKADK